MAAEFDIAGAGYKVRRATDADARACRMLLPAFAAASDFFVAEEGRNGLVVAVAAATRARRTKSPTGPGVGIHVIAPCRRQGIARSLLAQLLDHAAKSGDEALYAAQRIDTSSEDFLAWRSLGFAVVETVVSHELSVAGIRERLGPLVDWLRRNDRIPRDARIVPLYAADREQVLRLHLDCLGGDPDDLRRRLAGTSPTAFHPRYSRVLVAGQRIGGCVLARRSEKDAATVDAVIVAPELRNDWANAWLKLEACQGAWEIGVRRFLFSSFDQYQDTRLFASRLGGATTRETALLARPIAAAI